MVKKKKRKGFNPFARRILTLADLEKKYRKEWERIALLDHQRKVDRVWGERVREEPDTMKRCGLIDQWALQRTKEGM